MSFHFALENIVSLRTLSKFLKFLTIGSNNLLWEQDSLRCLLRGLVQLHPEGNYMLFDGLTILWLSRAVFQLCFSCYWVHPKQFVYGGEDYSEVSYWKIMSNSGFRKHSQKAVNYIIIKKLLNLLITLSSVNFAVFLDPPWTFYERMESDEKLWGRFLPFNLQFLWSACAIPGILRSELFYWNTGNLESITIAVNTSSLV